MEKQSEYSNNGRRQAAALKKEKRVLGVNLSEEEASKIVGGIVEKGMSSSSDNSPSSLPRPSLLPFPVARHRSHAPHWTPKMSHFAAVGNGVEEDDGDCKEDNDPTNYDPISEFAKPLKKKNKKGLDLRRWREFVPDNDVLHIREKGKNHSVEMGLEKQKTNGGAVKIADEKSLGPKPSVAMGIDDNSPSVLDVGVSTEPISSAASAMDLDKLNDLSSEKSNDREEVRFEHDQSGYVKRNSAVPIGRNNVGNEAELDGSRADMGAVGFSSLDMLGLRETPSCGPRGVGYGYEQGHASLESQIDAENRTLLERMSPDDIAEAQEEIRNRINPEVLKILKKRGLQKAEKQRNPSSGSGGGLGDVQAATHDVTDGEKESSVPQSNISSAVTPGMQNSGVVWNAISQDRSLWDTWSKRVEAVRTLRFSLDGNVVEGSSLDQTYCADNVAERDFLRTEGDPGAAGYTMKEALVLTRSVVPGQRALALHLLASVLSKALHNICKIQADCTTSVGDGSNIVDWEAIWAYALGPEPELVLSLRMALDDNHNSVVLASSKVIQCILACDVNENFFNRLEKMAVKDLCTAPIFRSRPDIKHGFLGGGFWKYSTKPSNILPFDEESMSDKNGGEHTIQDDSVVAAQDIAAGLVRMGILPRIRYLLETEPTAALEESILSILVAIARHSPICANAIWKCERLVQTIVDRFTVKDTLELQASKIKSVTLLRVLAQSSKTTCIEFITKGFFQIIMGQLYRATTSVDEWVKCGRENCKLASELMVEQLRLWKVCVMYGHCISYFTAFFPALCLWLDPPTFDKLVEMNVFHEFASISREAYLVLETLARRLPDVHSLGNTNPRLGDNLETWCWIDVGPMVGMALKWIDLKGSTILTDPQNGVHNTSVSSLLWIMSAVLHMLHTVLIKATPGDVIEPKGSMENGQMLPDLVARIACQIIKNGVLNFREQSKVGRSAEQCGLGSFVEKLCHFRHESDSETALASVWCLQGVVRVVVSIDRWIQRTRDICFSGPRGSEILDYDGRILDKYSVAQWRRVVGEWTKLVSLEWRHAVAGVELFGRGGPAPGVGVGWGAFGGGFWSSTVALLQADARLLIELLLRMFQSPEVELELEEETFITERLNSSLASSLVAGPGDKVIVENVFDIILQIPVLKYLDRCICHFLRGRELLKWQYTEAELVHFSKILGSHFRNRWLSVKKKKKKKNKQPEAKNGAALKAGRSLDTIHEDMETPSAVTSEDGHSLTVEWAHQRLPLPRHWLLSPIAPISDTKGGGDVPQSSPPSLEFLDIAKAGLFFLLGIEAMSSKLSHQHHSTIQSIPLIWKLHSLSVALVVAVGVLEEERSRDVYEALQSLYGRHLDHLRSASTLADTNATCRSGCLRFQAEIHENYSTFIENLVEQFAAISYGDLIYGRQIAVYLHQQVDAPVRLAAWNALSNARVLELLPPLDNCLSQSEGYLEPVEEDEGILEAYVKSWVSGSLDRAATRGSMAYTVVLHHLSFFLFNNYSGAGGRLLLRNKLAKSLLRDYSRKQQHEVMMLDLIRYNNNNYSCAIVEVEYKDQRFEVLREACEGNSQLLTLVDKLKSSISVFVSVSKQHSTVDK